MFTTSLLGIVIASVSSYVCNRYLRQQQHAHSAEQEVEWMFAFDVHSNAYLCRYGFTIPLQIKFNIYLIFSFLKILLFSNLNYCLKLANL
jgi:hypothetical protein